MDEFLRYEAADSMVYRPATIGPKTTLAEVEALFEGHDVESLPVVDENGVLLGVVTRLDLLKAFVFAPETMASPYEKIMRRPVETVMTCKPRTVAPDAKLTDVLQLMIDTRQQSLPVAIGALLIGVIARRDVMRALRGDETGPRAQEGGERRRGSTWMIARASLILGA